MPIKKAVAFRFAHAQLSHLVAVTSRFLIFKCVAGKRKVDGVQEPFNWAVPRVIQPGVDVKEYCTKLAGLCARRQVLVDFYVAPPVQSAQAGSRVFSYEHATFCDLATFLATVDG